jgi:hypothetical protein
MNDALVSLLNGAGIGDILIPKKDFIKEHKHIVGLLNKYNIPELKAEADKQAEELKAETGVDLTGSGSTHRESVLKKYNLADKSYSIDELAKISSVPKSILQEVYNRGVGAYKTQGKSVRLKHSFVKNVDAPMSKKLSKEQWGYARLYSFLNGNPAHDEDLRKNVGGFSKQSGFIRRLMAENALKHQGQYKKPTFPLHPKSTMDKQAEFDYKKIANANQRGFNTSEYGASPFITKHFGSVRAIPFERKRGVPPPLEPYSKKKTSTKKTQETEQQKEARKEFEEPPTDVVRDVVPLPQGKREITKENYDGYVDKYIESESDKLHFFQPEKGWSSDGGNAKWVGYYTKDNKFIKNNDYIIEPGINLKTIIVDYGRERFDNVLYIMTNKTYYIPIDECILKKGDETIEIQKIKIPSLNKYQDKYWCLYSPEKSLSFENRHRPIKVDVITKKETFTFILESQLDLEQQISIGRQASLILYGPKKTHQQHDSKDPYGFKRAEKLSKGHIKYETEVLRWYENRKYDDMVLTINGKRYRMYDKNEKFPLWNKEQFAAAEEE